MTKRKLIAATAVPLLALALGVLVVGHSPSPAAAKAWTLSDGTKVRWLKATYGTNHVVAYGNRLLDPIVPFIPGPLRTNFGLQTARLANPLPEILVLWFDTTNLPVATNTITVFSRTGRRTMVVPQGGGRMFYVSAVDASGAESSPVNVFPSVVQTNGLGVYAAMLGQYPRRAAQLNLRIYDSPASRTPLAQFTIRNPAPQHPPDWTPEPLPATRKTNDLEITLLTFETGTAPPTAGVFAVSGAGPDRPAARFAFEVKVQGKPTTDWEAIPAVVWNAAGDSYQISRRPTATRGDEPFPFAIAEPVWSEEPAWKLRVEAARKPELGGELAWTNRGIVIPPPGKIIYFDGPTNLLGMGINPEKFGSVQMRTVPAWPPGPDPAAYRNIDVSIKTPGMVLLSAMLVTDDRGHTARADSYNVSPPLAPGVAAPAQQWTFHYGGFEGATTLDLTIGLSRIYPVEFTVKPAVFRPAPVLGK